ncbi:MAG: sensor histidine kinase [Anaerolineaceae bacterium]
MSLQSRLTYLFSTLIGTVLLVFGVLVYGLVNLILIDQIDQRLTIFSQRIISELSTSNNNQINSSNLAEISTGEIQYLQLWRNSNELLFSRPRELTEPLDSFGLQQGTPIFRNSNLNTNRLRVVSIPLETIRGSIGVLQVGIDLTLVDITLRTLFLVLVFLIFIAVILAAISTWVITRQALSPLVNMTEVARQITETNDLTRRIPISNDRENDEIFQLITSFNETLERLDQILSSQKRLMADVSHELRTPLTVIKGEVGLMRKYKQVDEDAIKNVEMEVDRLTRLVGNLLMITQAETGDLPMDSSKFQIDELIFEVFHQMQTLASEKLNVCLENVEQLQIFGDRDRIKQALLNLVGNAIQYSPPNSKVCISMRKIENDVQISIKDSGPGIPKKDLDHIFDRFYRGEKSRQRNQISGFGLGLAITQFIIQQHHGKISVDSVQNEGTTFTIEIPINPDNMSNNSKI